MADWRGVSGRGRQQGGSYAHRGPRDFYADEGRVRGSQRVSPGGEYISPPSYGSEAYTDQGYGKSRYSDWRTEDRIYPEQYEGSSYARGEHRGRGPRGYIRSDDRIREDACDLLTDDPRIDASNLEVSVQGGEITLSGTVSSREQKRIAERLVELNVSGVKDVHNRLRVAIGETSGERTASPSARH